MSEKDNGISRRDLLITGSTIVAGSAMGVSLAVDDAEAAKGKKIPQVPRRILGKTKQSIPILLFGAGFRLNGTFDPKLAEAFRYGVNYIDAADCYGGGTCEAAVGSFHKRLNNRKKLWITSKSDQHDPKGFSSTVDASLKALQTNYIDLYYLHALKDKKYLSKELEKTVAQLKKDGKIRFFGFSCHNGNVVELMEAAAKLPWIDSIMFRYNFRQYGDKKLNAAIDKCHKAGIGLIAMKTQGSASSFEPKWKQFQKKGKWNKHQAVLKAVWADPRITAAVSHMDTFQKLRENIAAAIDPQKLTKAEVKELTKYAAATRSIACDGCEHICNAAMKENVQIGTTMRYLMYHDVYGQTEEAKELFGALPPEARDLEKLDFSAATAACPHNIDLNTHLKRAAKILV
ncbi:MAG TPA: hypothetical protein DCE42_01695 [Myxococcales bacterium]|nr:hypothetical protein [Deltaproteobacteria bacterium]MBU52358.1 hypothetical protein [Deltaproteobacteria bacterium]HAA53437.1 hypothetical protein [Myxococcales bacterium]|tara:strand:- start:2657 stop:3859 length:1203 start_codon:yes stop_codon:yes gene_type:complete